MVSERTQRRIERLLDEAEAAMDRADWQAVAGLAEQALRLDPDNADARAFLAAAQRGPGGGPILLSSFPAEGPPQAGGEGGTNAPASTATHASAHPEPAEGPASFVNGRYQVIRFLGEGGKKQVYLAKDTALDRDVAFALIKTDGLDEIGRDRIRREGQAMGRLGSHPHIVTVFDLGSLPPPPGLREGRGEGPQPYMTTELMRGGDVEGLLEKAPEHRLPLTEALRIAGEVCQGLEFAHDHGLVHRDLKPGNVWLTEDGVAKIGDFGLAVALDRSRLTQAGMMVGTVGYPP